MTRLVNTRSYYNKLRSEVTLSQQPKHLERVYCKCEQLTELQSICKKGIEKKNWKNNKKKPEEIMQMMHGHVANGYEQQNNDLYK